MAARMRRGRGLTPGDYPCVHGTVYDAAMGCLPPSDQSALTPRAVPTPESVGTAIESRSTESRVRIEFDLEDADSMRQARAHVGQAVEDTVAAVDRIRDIVNFHGVSDDHVRLIARRAARLALLMDRNPEASA